MDLLTCHDYERVLRGGGDIGVYSGTLGQRGGFAVGGVARGLIGSLLPVVKSSIGKAVKRNVKGMIVDKVFRGMSLEDSARRRGRKELGRVIRDVANAVGGPPVKKRKTKKTKRKTGRVKRPALAPRKRTRPVDIFE